MKNIKSLIRELIPPNNHTHREGFTNYHIIDSLSEVEKSKVVNELIKMLESSEDWLIGKTLSYMKSKDSIPILRERLENAKESSSTILWANTIFKINNSTEMADIALEEFQKIDNKYELISIFHILTEFQDSRINKIIENYRNHDDYLVAYNAQTALTKETIN